MIHVLLIVSSLVVLTACDRPKGSPTPAQTSTHPSIDVRLLTNIDTRRQWKSGAVKIHLAKPTISTFLKGTDGTRVLVHAWAANENDYSVAMMRVDMGSALYGITDEEFNTLRTH